jgi:hypothetical protein
VGPWNELHSSFHFESAIECSPDLRYVVKYKSPNLSEWDKASGFQPEKPSQGWAGSFIGKKFFEADSCGDQVAKFLITNCRHAAIFD